MMSRDKLKHQVRGQFLSLDKFIWSRDITFMSHRWLRYTMTAKQVNAAINVLLVRLPVNCCDMLHRVVLHSSGILFNTYSMKQPDLYYFETIKMTSQA